MIIEQIMEKNVLSLTPEDSISTALNILKQNKIRHIPITTKNRILVGIVSDRDIRDAMPSSLLSEPYESSIFQKQLKDIMKTEVITVHPLDFVEEAAAIFYEKKIGCLPVIKHGKLVGIITESDVLYTFVQLTGVHQPSSRIEVRVPNKAGMLSEVSAIFHKKSVNISSVLVYPDKDEQYKILVYRVQTMNPMGVVKELQENGYTVLWPNIPGMLT